jgi:phage tail-like protein
VVLLDVDTAVSVTYLVKIDGVELGGFHTCDGLGCEVVLETREEGGNNGMVWQLPTRLKYPNIKLSRPLGKDTAKVAMWFTGVAKGYTRHTATIEVRRRNNHPVATWTLAGVVPVRWSGPALSADSPKVLMETVELAHHGFTVEAK